MPLVSAEVDAKAAVVLAKQDQAIHRTRLAHIRKQEVEQVIKRIEALTPQTRLQLIASDETIPLGALPMEVISSFDRSCGAIDERESE